MAKYTITHTCGCHETVQLFGKECERQRKIDFLETLPCVDCQRKAEREAELEPRMLEAIEQYKAVSTDKKAGILYMMRKPIAKEFLRRIGEEI